MVDSVEGTHDTLPISKTFPNRSRSLVVLTLSKEAR
jgi:hypothetical protein